MEHGIVLDLEKGTCRNKCYLQDTKLSLLPQLTCNLILDDDYPQAEPCPASEEHKKQFDMLTKFHPILGQVLKDYKSLFQTQLGKTGITEHTINTGDAAPIKVPPHLIPFHFQEKVYQQLQDMARKGIIRPSSTPWCAPAVYVPKTNGEFRICVDYIQLNRVT